MDDAALISRAADDPEAFRTLFRRHVNDVQRYVRRRAFDDTLADDLTAQTFERLWHSLPTLEISHSTLRPWLFRVASNLLADHFRSEQRRQRREHTVHRRNEPLQDSHRDIDQALDGADTELVNAISRLNERHQTVISLRFLADLSTEEAAAAMEVDRKHFAVLQHRAIKALRRQLGHDTKSSKPTASNAGHNSSETGDVSS